MLQATGVAALGLAAYGVTGCEDEDERGETGDGELAEERGGELAEEQTLRIFSNEPTEIGPGATPGAANSFTRAFLFNGLYVYDKDLKVVPGDAEGFPESSSDGLRHRIKLRSGLKWSDGRGYGAEDYVFSVRDVQLVEIANLSDFFIKGVEEFVSGETDDPGVLGVRALDDETLEIETTIPAPFLPAYLAGSYAWWPIPRHKWEQYGPEWSLQDDRVSNGPYVLDTWAHNQHMVFVRNPEYQGPAANLDRVEATIFADMFGPAPLAAFEAGELDLAIAAPDDIERVLANSDEFNSTIVGSLIDLNCIVLNTNKPPLDDVRVRQALYLAIDREAIDTNIWKGVNQPIYKFINGEQPGADPDARPFPGDGPEKARELLSEAGYPGGDGFPKLEYISYGGGYEVVAQAIQQMWREELGIDIRIQALDAAAWVAAVVEVDPDADWGDLADAFPNQIFLDPVVLLGPLFDGGGRDYHHHWQYPPGLKERKDRALAVTGDERHRELLEIDLAIAREMPLIPYDRLRELLARKPYIVGGHQSNGYAWQQARYYQILKH